MYVTLQVNAEKYRLDSAAIFICINQCYGHSKAPKLLNFGTATATNCRGSTRWMHFSYSVGHKPASSLLFYYIVSVVGVM
jgi:hypothetical protein